jgi:uncharacterized protein
MKTRSLTLFFSILITISTVCYIPMIKTHTIGILNGWLVLCMMWAPGIAALITTAIYKKSFQEIGLHIGKLSFLFLGYFIPIIYATLTYGTIWSTGLGSFPDPDFMNTLTVSYPHQSSLVTFGKYALDVMLISFFPHVIRALGEEIGWRGFLVPTLAKKMSYTKVSIVIGLIWAAWHYPALLWTNYNIVVPAWYAIPCFTLSVIALSFILTWLRVRSTSIWPGVLLHSSHNALIQLILTPMTIQDNYTKFFIDEFGIGLIIATSLIAFICWNNKSKSWYYAR